MRFGFVVLGLLVALAACGGDDDDGGENATPEPVGGMVVASDSFQEGSGIPDVYTCVGDDQSPPLSWLDAPAEAVAFAVVMDDLDAGFVHWVMYDIPGDITDLPIDLPDGEELANGAKQGENDFGDVGYGGPCPPEGETHTYRFRVFALDQETGLDAAMRAEDVEAAIEGHVIETGQITTTAGR